MMTRTWSHWTLGLLACLICSSSDLQAQTSSSAGPPPATPGACMSDPSSSACAVAKVCMSDARAQACLDGLRNEAYRAAQWSVTNATSIALTQVSARFRADNRDLVDTVKRREDRAAEAKKLEDELLKAIGAGDSVAQSRFRPLLSAAQKDVAAADAILDASFPEYQELARPRPLSLSETQALLKPNEVMLFYYVATDETFVWSISRQSVVWHRIAIRERDLREKILALRKTLDPSGGCTRRPKDAREAMAATFAPFDFAASSELYGLLVQPIAQTLAGKHVIIAPSGILMSLPFATLIASPPPAPASALSIGSFTEAKWFGLTHALSVTPAPSSLRALRCSKTENGVCVPRAVRAPSSQAFIGFGAPTFRGGASAECRGDNAVFRGPLIDQDYLETLESLPNTEGELMAIAQALETSSDRVFTGQSATESKVKDIKLDARLIVFATHGLLANQGKGAEEAGLALTAPGLQSPAREATTIDDGYLSATEAAQLSIAADWVILSACNTALGNVPGSEGLSGLARAFFFAGADSMLVSQWPVYDDAAPKLTVNTVQRLAGRGAPERAEALRLAMQKIVDDAKVEPPVQAARKVHPSYWAPYMLVGG